MIGKDFIVNNELVSIIGYYDTKDVIATGTPGVTRCDKLKFILYSPIIQTQAIFEYLPTSEQEVASALVKYTRDNGIGWNAIDYLNIIYSPFSIKCVGMGIDATSKVIFDSVNPPSLKTTVFSITEKGLTTILIDNIQVLIREVSQGTTTPGLYFTPTGATCIFTKG